MLMPGAETLSIRSQSHTYAVSFVESAVAALSQTVRDGDFVIIDNKVAQLFPSLLLSSDDTHTIWIKASEGQKRFENLAPILRQLIENGIKRDNRLVAVGGGITQDITAFIASILFRGIDWVFFPTTLLAQADSCIGSKTSINVGDYKNQLGGFHPPIEIYLDLKFLSSLDHKEILSGFGEMLHYYVISGAEDFNWFKTKFDSAFSDKKVLRQIVRRSLLIKKSKIEIDEFDTGARQIFNYGHSFGHALESVTAYQIPHGIAVAMGLDLANFISVKLGFLSEEEYFSIRAIAEKIFSQITRPEINIDFLLDCLRRDKKNTGGDLTLILCRGIGDVFKYQMRVDDRFKGWLQEYFQVKHPAEA